MARKSGKTRTPIQQEYYKQRSRISKAIKRMEKQGYIFPEFSMPAVPKKITKSSISRLEKITPKSLREKYGLALNTSTGEVKEAQAEFNRRRIQSARQSSKTRERNKAQQFSDEYFPTKTNIVLNNFAEQAGGEIADGKEYFLDMIRRLDPSTNDDPDRFDFYKRPRNVQDKATRESNTLIRLMRNIIRNKQANKVAYNIFRNGDNPHIQASIDTILYSRYMEEVVSAFNDILAVLTDKGALSAQYQYELADRTDEDGYDYD